MTRRRRDVLTLIIASLIISVEEASVNVRDQAETNAPVTRQDYVCEHTLVAGMDGLLARSLLGSSSSFLGRHF